MLLQGYAVLKNISSVDDEYPFKVVRIEVTVNPSLTQEMVEHTVVADHASRNMALYWATQLNEGRTTEEMCKAEIEEARKTR